MKATKETHLAASVFAAKDGLDDITFAAIYKDTVAYYATSNEISETCSGYPHYVLVYEVKNRLMCRYSTTDEALEIMDLEK